MKKNKMMRAASILMVATLLTTSVISGTFAKYVTSGNASDEARVAKWGVKIAGTAETFKESYAKDDNSFTLNANTVVSTKDVVAPGTSGNMAAFTITGTPEVAVNVAFKGTLELGDNWVDSNSAYYCPIEITVGGITFKGTDYSSANDFEAAVNAKIATYSQNYAANTDLNSIGGDAPTISWEWPFETGSDESTKAANDIKDTFLGNQATKDSAARISLDVTVTVTQID